MTLPGWFRRHKRALAAPTHVHARAVRVTLDGEAHLTAEKVKKLIWQKYHTWPYVERGLNHKEHIVMAGIKVSWKPPTTRIDGTTVDATQYGSVVVSELQTDGNYKDLPPVAGDQTSLVLANVDPGSYAFNVRYVDVQGQQGAASADVAVTVPDTAPAVPAQLTAPTDVTVEVTA